MLYNMLVISSRNLLPLDFSPRGWRGGGGGMGVRGALLETLILSQTRPLTRYPLLCLRKILDVNQNCTSQCIKNYKEKFASDQNGSKLNPLASHMCIWLI